MKTNLAAIAILVLPLIGCLGTRVEKTENDKPDLWAAVSVSEPLVVSGQLKQFAVTFALANDCLFPCQLNVKSWLSPGTSKPASHGQFKTSHCLCE